MAVVIDRQHAIHMTGIYGSEQAAQALDLQQQVASKRVSAIEKGSVQIEEHSLHLNV